jgi:hypothetical protein
MSLAMTAASIDDKNEPTVLERKRQVNNRTQKRHSSEFIRPEKVNSVLNTIHNTNQSEDSEYLGDFNSKYTSVKNTSQPIQPINPYAQPALTRQPIEGMTNKQKYDYDANTNNSTNYSSKFVPQPVQDDTMDLQDLSDVYMNDDQVKKYFRNLLPKYDDSTDNKMNRGNSAINTTGSNIGSNSGSSSGSNTGTGSGASFIGGDVNQVLIDKINYMINLLEDQQDERTNNVTEEVILYSFLGIFIIFVVDSFARVSKYVR